VQPEPAAPPGGGPGVVPAPGAPTYGDAAAQPAVSYAENPYGRYYYYPYAGFFVVGGPAHPIDGARPGSLRQHRPPFGPRPRHG